MNKIKEMPLAETPFKYLFKPINIKNKITYLKVYIYIFNMSMINFVKILIYDHLHNTLL